MAKAKITAKSRTSLATAYVRQIEAGKQAYKKAGELLDRLVDAGPIGEPIPLPDGRTLVVTDQFAGGKNTCFKPTAFSRYKAEVNQQ